MKTPPATHTPHSARPRPDAIEATAGILEVSPHTGILILTMLKDDHLVFAAEGAAATHE